MPTSSLGVPSSPARVRVALRALRQRWPQLLDPAIATGGAGGSAVAGPRVPLLTEALHLRHHVPRELVRWCQVTANLLGVCPARPIAASDVEGLTRWLAEHARHLDDADPLERAAAERLAREVEGLVGEVVRVVAPTGARRVAVPPVKVSTGPLDAAAVAAGAHARGARCPMAHCHGALGMAVHPGAATAIVCSEHLAHRWEQDQWVQLATSLGDAAPARMGDVELAAWLSSHLRARIAPGTIRSWAARHPLSVRRDEAGTYDRLEVARWYVEHRERAHHA